MLEIFGASVLLIGFLLVWHEFHLYNRLKREHGNLQAGQARLRRRLFGVVLLVAVTAMTYAGIVNLTAFRSRTVFIAYWGICLLVLVSLMVLVVLDVRAVFKEVLRSFTDEIAEEERFRKFMTGGGSAETGKPFSRSGGKR